MLNINDENFVTQFAIKDAVVGQVGYGFIGKAVEALFIDYCKVIVYDKFMSDTASLDEVVKNAQVIFVAVPTPMDKVTGQCHTKILEEVLMDIQNAAIKVERDVEDFVVVIKSTVPPGFTRKMQTRHVLRIVFSPEFLTEANAIYDFKNAKRIILGGRLEDARVVFKFFEGVWPNRMDEAVDHPAGPVVIAQCAPELAEMVKLTTNTFLATKVAFFNEIYQICKKIDVDYEEMRLLLLLDTRINKSHTLVPGPDGHFGFGGSCFPKDINNLKFFCSELSIPEMLLTAVINKNNLLRPEKDWENLQGRAVIKEEK